MAVLHYLYDPLCGWCYGAEPLVDAARSVQGLEVRLHAGGLWPVPLAMFVVGWALQFAGHAVEGKPPEFFRDWRFLLVGLRWWVAKLRGRA